MRRQLVIGSFLLLVMAGGNGCDGDVVLDCDANCKVGQCVFGDATCASAATCTCMDAVYNEQDKAATNDCGSKSTCGEVSACWNARPARVARAIDQQVADRCGAYAVRCGFDSNMTCSLWTPPINLATVFSESYLMDIVYCYDTGNSCTSTITEQCQNYARPTSCVGN